MTESAALAFSLTAAVGMAFLIGAESPNQNYSVGQVWEYHTRIGDEGSLLKIQAIEMLPNLAKIGPVYHVSIIGVHFAGLPIGGEIQHAPFSRKALDASVIKLSNSQAPFPDASGGIAQWREAHGGVFTVSVADAVSFVEQTLRQQVSGKPSST